MAFPCFDATASPAPSMFYHKNGAGDALFEAADSLFMGRGSRIQLYHIPDIQAM